MPDITIPGLTETVTADNASKIIIETPAGTRSITRINFLPDAGDLVSLTFSEIDIENDTVWVLSNADGSLKEASIRDLVFGNFGNVRETQNFTLTPGVHNVQAVELGENLPDAVSAITLDGSLANIAGCDFYMVNFRNAPISVTAQGGITMFVNGVATDGTISARQAATITVNEDGTQAIFSGG